MHWTKKLHALTVGKRGALRTVARRTGKVERTLYRWTLEGRVPHNELEEARDIAWALDVDYDWFIDPKSRLPAVPADPKLRGASLASAALGKFADEYAPIVEACGRADLLPSMLAHARRLLR